jgi:molecular chaperone GrpE
MPMNGQPDSPELEAGDVNPEIEADAEESLPEEADPEAVFAELQAKVDENWDRYLRSAAEVENVRKRAVRDVERARKFALENFGRELLEVRDSLELGSAAADASDVESILAGGAATLKLLSTTFERFGIVEVDPEGEPFDPELHEAMTVQPSVDAEPGSVLTVIQKGYTLNGRLLRPARVIVAAEPADPE